MSEETIPTVVTEPSATPTVEKSDSTKSNVDEGDESVYKRGQQNKWARTRKGDKRDEDTKRPRKEWQREHKVQYVMFAGNWLREV